jgi:CHAT domain-containing protein
MLWRGLILVALWLYSLWAAPPLMAAPPAQANRACTQGLEAFYAGDDEAALHWLETAYGEIDPTQPTPEEADCALVLCALWRGVGRMDEAVEACRRGAELAFVLEDAARQSIAAFTLGDTLREMGDLGGALAAYDQSFDAALAADDGVGVLIALTRMGTIYQQQGRAADAAEVYQLALDLARDLDNLKFEQQALTELGAVYKSLGRYADAEAALTTALDLAQTLADPQAEATTWIHLGGLYQVLGRYADADAAYGAVLALGETGSTAALRAAALGGLGSVAWNQGLNGVALDHYTAALELAQAAGDLGRVGHLLNNIGLVYLDQGRYGAAAAQFTEALTVARSVRDLDEEAAALHNTGRVLGEQGRLAEALSYYDQALALVQATGLRLEESIVRNSMAAILADQGRYAEALAGYDQALEVAQAIGSRSQVGVVLANRGLVLEALARYDDAAADYLEALAIAQALGEQDNEALRLNNLAGMYSLIGDDDQAITFYEQALALERELGDTAGQAAALNNLAAVYFAQMRDDAALALLQEGLVQARTLGDPLLLSSMLTNLAKVQRARDDLAAAQAALEEALPLVDSARAVAGSEAGRAGVAARYAELYQLAVALYHQVGREADAFRASEQGRARAFLDALATGEVQLSDQTTADLLARERELYARLLGAQYALAATAALRPPDATRVAQAQADLAAVEAGHQAILAEIDQAVAQVQALVPGRSHVPDVAEVQTWLDAQTTLVSFYVLPDEAGTLAFVLTAQTFRVVELPAARAAALRGALSDLTLWLDLDDPHPQPLVDLYTWLFAPLLPYLTTPVLGMLHYAPVAALSDGSSYLGERFTLFLTPSAAALPFIRANAAAKPGATLPAVDPTQAEVLVYGNPATDAGLALLVHAEEEAAAISSLFDAPFYTRAAASEKLLRNRAPDARILHLAAHGAYNRANPLYSTIFLAPDEEDDGRLEVHEVYGLTLDQNELVVLSACETSLGQLSSGDELVGLTRAFFFAGAPTVIASLWTVDDLATKELMLAFYTGLDAGLSKAAALQAAQQQVRATYPSPFYWAAFVLNGDPGQGEAATYAAAVPGPPPTTGRPNGPDPTTGPRGDGAQKALPWWERAAAHVLRAWR